LEAFAQIVVDNDERVKRQFRVCKESSDELCNRGEVGSEYEKRWRSGIFNELGEKNCWGDSDPSCRMSIISDVLERLKRDDVGRAKELFADVQKIEPPLFRWRSLQQTPLCFWPELDSIPWFTGTEPSLAPVFAALRSAFNATRHELMTSYLPRFEAEMDKNVNVMRNGWLRRDLWNSLTGWNEEGCNFLPTICKEMRPVLPTSRLPITWSRNTPQEELTILGTKSGITLAQHNDGLNTRVNVLMSLLDSRGSILCVVGDCRPWEQDGDIHAFDVSFDHTVENPTTHTRWVVVAGVSHPQYEERFSSLQPRPNLVQGSGPPANLKPTCISD
jgi:hypothetical protein